MRTRPIGPGVGGLYYGPALRKADTSAAAASGATSPGTFARVLSRLARAARRAGDRIVAARMATAERYVALARQSLDASSADVRRPDVGTRYY